MARLDISPDMIQCQSGVENWEEAIRVSARPLLAKGAIREAYVDAMIETVRQLGPYIVIAPMIALPHARSADALAVGLAVLKLERPVSFGPEAEATLILPLSVTDDESHIAMLQLLACLLGDEERREAILAANDPESLYRLLTAEIATDDL